MLKVVVAEKIRYCRQCHFFCPKCGKRYNFMVDHNVSYLIGTITSHCSRCITNMPAVYGILRWPDARIRFHRKKEHDY